MSCSFTLLFIVAFLAISLNYFDISSVEERDMLVWSSELVTNWDKMKIKDHFFEDYDKALKKSKRPKRSRRLRQLKDKKGDDPEVTEQEATFGFMTIYKSDGGASLWNKFYLNTI